MKYWILVGFIAWFSLCVTAQEHVLEINFIAYYNNNPLVLKSKIYQFQEKDMTFTRLKYYITNVELCLGDQIMWKEENSYHLIDLAQIETTKLALKIPQELEYDNIKYQLGIDSLTNVSGAMGGDLDPTKGMYWAWNSGYINFKLEGIHEDCPTRKSKFQFHLGGYANKVASIQNIEHKIVNEESITINVQVDQFLKDLDLKEEHSLMSPSTKAVVFAERAALIFRMKDE